MSARHRSRPDARSMRIVGVVAVLVALFGTAGTVWQASYAAFSATTNNPSDSWSAGTVVLTDDDSNAAMFTATNLKPGSTGSKCILVTSTSSLASSVKMYGTSHSTTNGLSSYINLTISQGSSASFSSCGSFAADASQPFYTGTLANFASTATAFGSGLGSWTPAGGTNTKAYQFTYTVDSAAPNSVQGGTSSISFVWEAQNT